MGKNKTQIEWINEANSKHNNKYDYSKVQYVHSESKVTIICPIHGEFKQKAYRHLQGYGCPKCAIENARKLKTKSFDKVIFDFKKIHGERYDYSKVKYVNNLTPVLIGCKIHGYFEQTPQNHLRGCGCPKCAKEKDLKYDTKTFIEKCIELYGNNFLYDKLNYTGIQNTVIIGCSKCKRYFERISSVHLQYGLECPYCKTIGVSKGEKEIVKFIETIYHGEIKTSDRSVLSNNNELDIYIPSKNLAIEFDGLYWHSEINKSKDYHLQKTIECESKGIQLIHIFEDEWLEKHSIVESRIRQLLGLTKYKIYARNCNLRVLNTHEERMFFDNNHLQGFIGSNVCYGLIYKLNGNEYIVAAMSFGPLRKNLGSTQQDSVYEMYRFACLKNFSIIGAASKLFKHFLKRINPKQIISYADRRWSSGNLYKQLGFEFVGYTEPSYFYINGNKRINRFMLRKDVLVSKYNCPSEMSEHDFCFSKGLYKIYDVGNLKFVYENSKFKKTEIKAF